MTFQENKDTLELLGYALVDTDDDRYIVYQDEELVIDENGGEDIRMISTSYDRRKGRDIIIRSTSSNLSSQRVEKIIALLKAFGVSDEDITQSIIREELRPYDDIIQLSIRAKDEEIVYAGR